MPSCTNVSYHPHLDTYTGAVFLLEDLEQLPIGGWKAGDTSCYARNSLFSFFPIQSSYPSASFSADTSQYGYQPGKPGKLMISRDLDLTDL